ncbi:MAG: hypothetical protein QF371_01895 [Flavobacteriales bacterium]|nr:hypothetical protein [Flavobacteriales bacterium]
MRPTLPLTLVIALCTTSLAAQNVVQVEIDHGALHCPYLSPRFESRFAEMSEIDSVHVNTQTSIGTLYLSNGMTISDEQITDVIVNKVGYPKQEIKAIIRDEN